MRFPSKTGRSKGCIEAGSLSCTSKRELSLGGNEGARLPLPISAAAVFAIVCVLRSQAGPTRPSRGYERVFNDFFLN